MTAAGHVTGTGPWLKRFHAAPKAGARLVCFPHAGAAASACHGFSASLTPRVEVLSVQYPGREDRYAEPMVDDVGLLADAVAAVLPPWCDRPLALFGHSMGAIVAFEVARRLGPRVDALFVSGRRAPSTYRAEDLHRRDDSGLVEAICALGGTDLRLLDAETVRMLLPLVRNDLRAAETYSHGAGPDLSCSVFAHIWSPPCLSWGADPCSGPGRRRPRVEPPLDPSATTTH